MGKNQVKITLDADDKGSAKVQKFGKDAEKAVSGVSSAATVLRSTLAPIGGAIAAAFSVGSVMAMAAEMVKVGDSFNDMSMRTGIATETLSAMAYVAQRSGTDINAVEKNLKFLSKAMDDTSRGTGESRKAFADLGISVQNTDGTLRPMMDVLKDAADKLNSMDDETRKVVYAQRLFGRSGTEMLPILGEGSKGIEELMQRSKELGLVWSKETAEAAADLDDTMVDLKGSFQGLKKEVFVSLGPALRDWATEVTSFLTWLRRQTSDDGRSGAYAKIIDRKQKELDWLSKAREMDKDVGISVEAYDKKIAQIKIDIQALERGQKQLAEWTPPKPKVLSPPPSGEDKKGKTDIDREAEAIQKYYETEATAQANQLRALKEYDEATFTELRRQADQKVKMDADYARASLQIYESMRSSMEDSDSTAYDLKLDLLDEQYRSYRDHLTALAERDEKYADGVVMLDKWVADQRKSIWKDWARQNGSITDTMLAAYDDFAVKNLSASTAMYDTWTSAFEDVRGGLEETLFATAKRRIEDIDDLWKALGRSMVDDWIRTVAKIASQEITISLFSSVAGGAASGAAGGMAAGGGGGLIAGAGSDFFSGALGYQGMGTGLAADQASLAYMAGEYLLPVAGLTYAAHALSRNTTGRRQGLSNAQSVFAPFFDPVGTLQNILGLGGRKRKTEARTFDLGYDDYLGAAGADRFYVEYESKNGRSFGESSGSIRELTRASAVLEDYKAVLEGLELPEWAASQAMTRLTDTLVEQGQNVSLTMKDWAATAGYYDKTLAAAMREGIGDWAAQIEEYYGALAQASSDTITSAIREGLTAPTLIEGVDAFMQTMNESLYNTIVDTMIAGMTSSAVFQDALAPFFDAVNQGMGEAMVNGVFDPQLFRQIIDQPLSAAVSGIEALVPAFREIYGILDDLGSGLGVTSSRGYAGGGIASGPESGYWERLHGTEAIIPLKGGAVPVQVQGGRSIEIHLHGTVIDRQALNAFAEEIYPRIKQLGAWGH